MDLVVGASGLVGKQIALGLRNRGRAVRAFLRGGKAHAAAEDLSRAGMEIVDGDLTRPETLAPALQNIDTVICTATSMPHGADNGIVRVDHDGALALIDAAAQSPNRKFIYLSYTGNMHADSPLQTAKRDSEKRLLDGPMSCVILRPSFFMESWLSPALGFDPVNGSARIYGSGDTQVSYISAADVARFAVAVAIKNQPGKIVLEIGGPEPLSQKDAVQVFESKLQKKVQLDFLPVEAIEQQHRSTDPLQKTFGALMLGYTKGDVIPDSQPNAAKYGISLRSVADYAAEHAGSGHARRA
ncbi:MAG: NAD(P)H-binding protein [Acidobacteriota bacterium]|nr:NAD(P)H-binding protein [Acidobacteriota bacterium]